MKNSKKDEYDHKLYRFVQELNQIPFSPFGEHDAKRTALLKKYGFTEEDVQRSFRIVRSIPMRKCFWDGIGVKKDVLNKKEKVAMKIEEMEACDERCTET